MFDDKKKEERLDNPEEVVVEAECTCEDDECDCEPEEITLIGEDGSQMEFVLLGVTKVDDKEYAALAEPGSNDFIVFEIRLVDDYYEFLDIETDDEYNRIGEAFEKYFDEEDDIDDESVAPPKKERAAKGKNDKSKPAKPAGSKKPNRHRKH